MAAWTICWHTHPHWTTFARCPEATREAVLRLVNTTVMEGDAEGVCDIPVAETVLGQVDKTYPRPRDRILMLLAIHDIVKASRILRNTSRILVAVLWVLR